MAKKPTVTTVASGYYGRQALNNNFEALRDAFDNTLSLDGSTPNAMGADLDMNSRDILNAETVNTEALRLDGVLVGSSDLTATGGSFFSDSYTGTGSTVDYTMSYQPFIKDNTQVYIDGVYQNKADYSISGTTLTFDTAPALNAEIEIVVARSLTTSATDAANVSYNHGGSGASNRTVEAKLQETISVKDFGAVGDGVTNDAAAFTAASTAAGSQPVYVPTGSYAITGSVTGDFYTFGEVTIVGGSVDAVTVLADPVYKKAPLPVSPNLNEGDLANLSFYKDRDFATNRDDADTMSADLTDMAGYASHASTTGGGSNTIYFVTEPSDSTSGYANGSFRWAVEQVRTAGSGRVVFDPENSFDIVLQSQIETPPNITIDAPARNVTIWRPDDVTGIKVADDNCVIRRLSFKTVSGSGGSARDAISLDPTLCDKVWIDECTFGESSDGCIDMASLSDLTATCNVTVSNCVFRGHDKVMLIGSLACYNDPPPAYCPTATAETPQLLVTLYKNVFDHVAQRNPKVVTKAFVHSINNYYRIKKVWQPSQSAYGAAYGALAATGGQVFSEANLYSTAVGSGFSAVDAVTTAQVPAGGGAGATDGPGLSKDTGSVTDNSMTITEVSPGSVTTPPYSLTAASITDTEVGRAAFAESIYSGAGATLNPACVGLFSWHPDNTQDPDGWQSISLNGSISGRFLRVDKRATAPSPFPWKTLQFGSAVTVNSYTIFEVDDDNNTTNIFQLATPRVSTLTISSGAITVIGGYHTVSPESGNTDDLDTINFTDTPTDGQRIRIRPTSLSHDITVKHNTGNILLKGGTDIVLDGTYGESLILVWDSALSKLILESV